MRGGDGRRGLYAPAEMARLIAPQSVVVVGVSERPNAFGSRTVANMKAFDGRLYQINAKHSELAGRPCYPNITALPETPDCVVIATPREAVESIALECAARGVGAILVFAAGFAETGKPEHVALQKRLLAIAQDAKMRMVGPNTIGLVNYAIGAGLTFSAMPDRRPLKPHAIGIVSQSGSLGFSLAQAVERGVSVSHVLSAGNSCDVDVADQVAYLAQDQSCSAMACLFEGMADPGRMLQAAELAWKSDKPLIMYKIATGKEGARAAMSHTGSLAGSEAAYAAGFARAGVIQVDKLEALVEATSFFAKAGAPRAQGTIVIATSGGATIIAADKAELHDVPLPQPGPEAAAVLAREVPEYGSTRNPCDVTAQVVSSSAGLAACADALLADPLYGVMVTSHAYAYEFGDEPAARLQPGGGGEREDRLQRLGAGMAWRPRLFRDRERPPSCAVPFDGSLFFGDRGLERARRAAPRRPERRAQDLGRGREARHGSPARRVARCVADRA